MNKRSVKKALIGVSRVTGLTALSRILTRRGFNIIGFHGVSLLDEHRRFPTLFISAESFERRPAFSRLALSDRLAAGRIGAASNRPYRAASSRADLRRRVLQFSRAGRAPCSRGTTLPRRSTSLPMASSRANRSSIFWSRT